jgi:hypothetical protein
MSRATQSGVYTTSLSISDTLSSCGCAIMIN